MSSTDIQLNIDVLHKTFEQSSSVDARLVFHEDVEYLLYANNGEGHEMTQNERKIRSVVTKQLVTEPYIKIIACNPSSSIRVDKIQDKKTLGNATYEVSKVKEGALVTLFYEENYGKWIICTKKNIGANNYFVRNEYTTFIGETYQHREHKTFNQMVKDVFGGEESYTQKTGLLNKNYSYSFVLQHESNEIVYDVNRRNMILVSVYDVSDRINALQVSVNSQKELMESIGLTVNETETIQVGDFEDELSKVRKIEPSIDFIGYLYTNVETGEKYMALNGHYTNLRSFLGNDNNERYRFLRMKKAGCVDDFLFYFPRYIDLYATFNVEYTCLLNTLYQKYMMQYVMKEKKPMCKPIYETIKKIHVCYFVDNKIEITPRVINIYMDTLSEGEQLHLLNAFIEEYNKPIV